MAAWFEPPPGIFRFGVIKRRINERPHFFGDPSKSLALLESRPEQRIERRQVDDIRQGVTQLGVTQGASRPICKTTGLVDLNLQHLSTERVIGNLFAKSGRHAGDLGIKQRSGNSPEIVEDFHILASRVEHLFDALIAHNLKQRCQVYFRGEGINRDRDLGRGRLNQAKLRPIGCLAHKFRVDGDERLASQVIAEGRQLGGGGDQSHCVLIEVQPKKSAICPQGAPKLAPRAAIAHNPAMTERPNSLTYATSGVDIDAGAALVERIKPLAKSTRRAGAEASLGGFGALFDLKAAGYDDPLIVSTTDGVGTKLRVAIEAGRHGTVGIDLVAMCVNDLLAQGAEPLAFLDYFATGHLDVEAAAEVVSGIAEGCRQAGAALVGGETAEMPGMYRAGDYDLAGFCLGAVARDGVLPRLDDQRAGDVMIALASSGPHSNGYSLIRKVVEVSGLGWASAAPFAATQSLGEALLTPTRIYVKSVLPLAKSGMILGGAHITGGGLIENPPRAIAEGLVPRFDWAAWELPSVFSWLAKTGGISELEMRRTFNCGIGFILIATPEKAGDVLAALLDAGETAFICGDLAKAS